MLLHEHLENGADKNPNFPFSLTNHPKKSLAHSPWSIHTALFCILIIGQGILIVFLPDRAIVHLFTLS